MAGVMGFIAGVFVGAIIVVCWALCMAEEETNE